MQTSGYADNQALGIAGQLADQGPMDAVTLQNSETTGIAYGTGVVDKGDGTFEDPDAATKRIRGVLLHTHAEDNANLDPAGLPTKKMGDVLTRGRVVVIAETVVAAGDEAYCRIAGTGTKGAWRNDTDGGNAIHVNRIRFRRATSAVSKPTVLELLDGAGEPDIVYVDAAVGALAATTTIELGAVPTNRHVKVRSATLSCGIAAGDGANNWVFQVRSGATVLASHGTDAAAQGAIVQNTPKAMVVANAAGRSLERLTLVATKNGTAANLTAGQVMVELEVY